MFIYRYVAIVLMTCFFSSLYSNVFDHLKPAEGKSDIHKMRNIDFIYMINLDQRPEKFEKSINKLQPYGIYPYRFSAVNGWELSLEDINNIGVKYVPGMVGGFMGTMYLPEDEFHASHELIQNYDRTYFCHCMSRGAMGIVLSHLSILKDAYESGYETIWVMEDDIEVLQDPTILSGLIDQLDGAVRHDGWDVLFTDRDTKDRNGNYVCCKSIAKRPNYSSEENKIFYNSNNLNKQFRKLGLRYGAYSMIIRRSGMEKLLNFYKTHQIFLPYDMDYYFAKNIKMFTVLNDVISTDIHASSDNGGPFYLH